MTAEFHSKLSKEIYILKNELMTDGLGALDPAWRISDPDHWTPQAFSFTICIEKCDFESNAIDVGGVRGPILRSPARDRGSNDCASPRRRG